MAQEYFVIGTFKASSGNKWWRVSRDDRGELSCTCPGWCRRVAKDGTRDCKHLRKVRERGSEDVRNAPVRSPRTPLRARSTKLGVRRFRL